jgi:phosphoribosylamine--glycine ligase
LEFESKQAACIVLASNGYPGEFEKGLKIKLTNDEKVLIFHAGLKRDDKGGKFYIILENFNGLCE